MHIDTVANRCISCNNFCIGSLLPTFDYRNASQGVHFQKLSILSHARICNDVRVILHDALCACVRICSKDPSAGQARSTLDQYQPDEDDSSAGILKF